MNMMDFFSQINSQTVVQLIELFFVDMAIVSDSLHDNADVIGARLYATFHFHNSSQNNEQNYDFFFFFSITNV